MVHSTRKSREADLVTFPVDRSFTGAVRVVQAGTKPVKVDAVSVLR